MWNAVEKIEKNKNAQLSREIEIALPKELNSQQQIELAHDYCRKFFVSAGMYADICIHDKQDGNPHAHVILTMRPFERDGNWAAKSKKEYVLDKKGKRIRQKSGKYKSRKVDAVDWNDQTKAEEWRSGWADLCNAYLAQNNVIERVDHRSYERQGIEQIPTIHLGSAASAMEKRGIRTERGNINREIAVTNHELRQIRARIKKLNSGLDEMLATADPPSINLVDALTGILENPEDKTRYRKIFDLKTVAKAIAFLQQNDITDLLGLHEKVKEMHQRQNAASGSLKKVERRMKTLGQHILHADNYFRHWALYKEYTQQKPGKQAAFYEHHRAELTLYETAEKYLKQVTNDHTTIPLKEWKAEAASLTDEKKKLYEEYAQLKDEVQEAEVIRRCVERIVRDEPGAEIKQTRDAKAWHSK